MDNFVAWYYRFVREKKLDSLTYWLSSLEASAQQHWWDDFFFSDGSFGSLKKRVIFITHSNDYFFSRGGPSVSSRLCMCICFCLSVSMYRNYNDTQLLALSFSNALSRVHRAISRSLTLTFTRVVTALVLCSFCFFCFKNQSFISWESFFSFFVRVMQFL